MARSTRRGRASGQIGATRPVTGQTRQSAKFQPGPIEGIVRRAARWDVGLAGLAWLSWFGGHADGSIADLAIRVWVVSGLTLGMVRPRFGLALAILVVPYLGGTADPANAELLRVIPVLGSAVRISVDRLRGVRTSGAPRGEIIALALVASGLFVLTALTAYLSRPNAEALVLAALPWLLGAPVAFLAAWITAAHDGELSDELICDVVLVSTVLACLFALLAWSGSPWTRSFAYPADVTGRLSAFGYPTPTGIGVAIALPFAVAAARRRHVLAAIAVLALGLVTVVLTGSRGPLVALGVGGLVAFAVSGRLGVRTVLAGAGIAAVVTAALVAVKYGTTPEQIRSVFAEVNAGDAQRVQSWREAIEVAVRNPIVGGGWDSLSRIQDSASTRIAASHNMLLSAFADGGFPLGLAFGAVLAYSVMRMWTNRTRLAPYALAGATVLLVTGLWDIPNLRSYGAVMGGLALGMATRSVPRSADQVPADRANGSRRRRRLEST